jgi:hypothetical protein
MGCASSQPEPFKAAIPVAVPAKRSSFRPIPDRYETIGPSLPLERQTLARS